MHFTTGEPEPGIFSHITLLHMVWTDQRFSTFAGDIVSLLSLWYKWALKSSYKKCRFAPDGRHLCRVRGNETEFHFSMCRYGDSMPTPGC